MKSRAGDRPEEREATETVYGLRAGLAAIARRPGEVVRVAFSREVKGELGEASRWAASSRAPFAEARDEELARLAGSKNHEGLCVVTRPRRWAGLGDLADALARQNGTAVAFDRVRNPYNIGAILRTAAFFGVDAALFGAQAPHPGLPADAVRVAEGGAEHLLLSRSTDLADTLRRLKERGVRVLGADMQGAEPAFGYRFERPCVLVLGNEREGLSDRVLAQCDATVAIPGTGSVESLNVAIAASILVAEMTRPASARQQPSPSARPPADRPPAARPPAARPPADRPAAHRPAAPAAPSRPPQGRPRPGR